MIGLHENRVHVMRNGEAAEMLFDRSLTVAEVAPALRVVAALAQLGVLSSGDYFLVVLHCPGRPVLDVRGAQGTPPFFAFCGCGAGDVAGYRFNIALRLRRFRVTRGQAGPSVDVLTRLSESPLSAREVGAEALCAPARLCSVAEASAVPFQPYRRAA